MVGGEIDTARSHFYGNANDADGYRAMCTFVDTYFDALGRTHYLASVPKLRPWKCGLVLYLLRNAGQPSLLFDTSTGPYVSIVQVRSQALKGGETYSGP